jgi:hypothetical protein
MKWDVRVVCHLVITYDIVDRGTIGAREEVGEEVHHHQTVLLGLQQKHILAFSTLY